MKYEYHSLFLRTEIFLHIIFVTGFSHLSGSKGVVKKQTKQECTAVGGRLTNFNGLQERYLQQEILSQLQHKESAWIEDYAKFSPFLAWHGCVASLKDVPYVHVSNHSLDTPNLYACVQKCAQRKMKETYVGIKLKICFCFTNKISEANLKSVSSVFCSTPCSTASMDMCGGTNYTSLYRIVNNIAWAENEPSPRQCVNVIKGQERFSASTASCFTLSLPKYICTRQLFLKLNSSLCHKSDYREKYCLVRKRSTRQEAFNDCLDKNGTLIEYFGENYSRLLMQVGARYWLSVFRTFKPTKRNNTNGMGCLSIIKISNNLYLDADSCETEKPYLCQISNNRTTTSSKSANSSSATFKPTKPVATSTKDSRYRPDDLFSLSTTFSVHSTRGRATVISRKDSVYNNTSASRTEPAVTNTTSNTQWFGEKNCTSKKRSSQTISLSVSLDTVTIPLVQTTRSRTAIPIPPPTPYVFKQTNSSFTILHTTNQINISSTIPKQMSSNRNKNEPQLIYYILPSSFVFIIFVVIAVVVCMRKRKQQLQPHKKGHSASAVSKGKTWSFSRNYQNVDRNASNTVHYAAIEIEGIINESQKNQYDRIHFTELKIEDCNQINQYDHTTTGATSNYINVGYTSFTHTEEKNSDSFSSFDSSFDSDYSKIAGSEHHIASDSGEQEKDHIYHALTCD